MDFVDRMRTLVGDDMSRVIRVDEWNRLCDGIEAKCERLVEEARSESEGMRDFCERLEEAAKKREDVTLFDVDYVALPVDEDGVAIKPGDVIDGYGNTFEVSNLILTRFLGWVIETDTDDRYIDSYAFKHHKEQDVYEVMKELCERYTLNRNGEAYVSELDELIREYADRFELKGSSDE